MECILKLKRIEEHTDVKKEGKPLEDSTISDLILYDEYGDVRWRGYACENIGPSTDESGTDKRIMPGEYYLTWCASNKNNSLCKKYSKWRNQDGTSTAMWVRRIGDKKFDNRLIRIHVGNYPQDTEGCILPGKTKGKGIVGSSVDATHELFSEIERLGIRNIVLIIEEF